MAAKKPAAKKTAKSVKSSKTTQAKTRKTALSGYTAAQRKAYRAASSAAIRRIQVLHNTSVIRARKRLALQKILGKLRAKGGERVVARARAYAAKQAYLQARTYRPKDRTLVRQAAHQLFKAQSVATQKDFAFKGEAIHARAYAAGRRKKRVTAARTRKPRTARTANPYVAFGAAYGRAAAARVPGPVKAPKKRKAAKGAPVEATGWITAGNDGNLDNCVAVALANHLLYHTGLRLKDSIVNYLRFEQRIDKALERVDYGSYWSHDGVGMDEYGMVPPDEAAPGMLVGFETDKGSHCGLLLPGGKVVSWGEIVPLETAIDEAWTITWTTKAS